MSTPQEKHDYLVEYHGKDTGKVLEQLKLFRSPRKYPTYYQIFDGNNNVVFKTTDVKKKEEWIEKSHEHPFWYSDIYKENDKNLEAISDRIRWNWSGAHLPLDHAAQLHHNEVMLELRETEKQHALLDKAEKEKYYQPKYEAVGVQGITLLKKLTEPDNILMAAEKKTKEILYPKKKSQGF